MKKLKLNLLKKGK